MQITKERLEAWLFAQPRERVFVYIQGLPKDQPGCVLCNFLRETTNANFKVSAYEIVIDGLRFRLEQWLVDLLFSWNLTYFSQRIPASAGLLQDLYKRTLLSSANRLGAKQPDPGAIAAEVPLPEVLILAK